MAEPGEALAYTRAADHGEARGYTRPAGRRAGPACIRQARQEERAASRPSVWRGRAGGRCRAILRQPARERGKLVFENAASLNGRMILCGRALLRSGDGCAMLRLTGARAASIDCGIRCRTLQDMPPRTGHVRILTNGVRLPPKRRCACCPKIWAKPRKFDGNVGAKVMIVRRWIVAVHSRVPPQLNKRFVLRKRASW